MARPDADEGELRELNPKDNTGKDTVDRLVDDIEVGDEEGEVVSLEGDDADDRIGKGREGEGNRAEAKDRGGADETPEQKRDRRRQEKRAAKERRAIAMNRDKAEVRFLRTMVDQTQAELAQLRQSQVGTQVSTIDSRINWLEDRIRQADQVMAAAVENQNGEDFTKAQGIRDKLVAQRDKLQGHKQQTIQSHQRAEQARQQGPAQQAPDPIMVAEFSKFQERNPWFDRNARDTDSRIVFLIDQEMTEEGKIAPDTPAYWRELEKRVAKKLPHRFGKDGAGQGDDLDDDLDDDDDDLEGDTPPNRGPGHRPNAQQKPPQRQSGPRMPGSGNGRGAAPAGSYYLTPERKQAMMDAGVWDDPVLRKKYAAKYKEWDERNPRRDR